MATNRHYTGRILTSLAPFESWQPQLSTDTEIVKNRYKVESWLCFDFHAFLLEFGRILATLKSAKHEQNKIVVQYTDIYWTDFDELGVV